MLNTANLVNIATHQIEDLAHRGRSVVFGDRSGLLAIFETYAGPSLPEDLEKE